MCVVINQYGQFDGFQRKKYMKNRKKNEIKGRMDRMISKINKQIERILFCY